MKKNLNFIAASLIALTIFSGCDNKSVNSNITANNSGTAANATNATKDSNTAIVIDSANTASNVNTSNSAGMRNNTKSPTSSVAPQDYSKLNFANYSKLQNNMTYPEAVKILGSEGEIFSENDYAGAKMIMYKWSEPSGAFIKVIFQNGKLLDKVQTGLK